MVRWCGATWVVGDHRGWSGDQKQALRSAPEAAAAASATDGCTGSVSEADGHHVWYLAAAAAGGFALADHVARAPARQR